MLTHALRILLAIALVLIAGVAHGLDEQVADFPDTCNSAFTPGDIQSASLGGLSGPDIYWTATSLEQLKVVMIVNGNTFIAPQYRQLAEHLALNGFIASIIVRPSGGVEVESVLDGLQDTLDHLGIDPDDRELEVGLIGHSKGGQSVVEAAIINDDENRGYPIVAVASLAPLSTSENFNGSDAAAFLVIYGSQDEDVDGYNNAAPNEGFAAYDLAGTESTTTCNSPPCLFTNRTLERTMVFVYGADHAGLIGYDVHAGPAVFDPQDLEYLSGADQLCITKAYVTGFLRHWMHDIPVYQGLLRDQWQPLSVSSIDTNKLDAWGNAIGSDMRLFVQSSPAAKNAIQNFEAGLGVVNNSGGVVVTHKDHVDFGDPHYVRHRTALAQVEWEADFQTLEWVRFGVPEGSHDASSYTHFGIRLGQLAATVAPYQNQGNVDQKLWIVIEDSLGQQFVYWEDEIPSPDLYTDVGPSEARSAMHTVRIPVDRIDLDIDIDDITSVYLVFPGSSAGTLLVDNLEWHRD